MENDETSWPSAEDAARHSVRWWAVFALRRNLKESERRLFLGSEVEPFEGVVDITDLCAESAVSAELFFELARPKRGTGMRWTGSRVRAGWIDEHGRIHATAPTEAEARQIVRLFTGQLTRAGSWEVVHRTITIGSEDYLTAIEVWALTAREPSRLEGSPQRHRFLMAEVRIG